MNDQRQQSRRQRQTLWVRTIGKSIIMPSNVYLHVPEQHPNLILGSLQLPIWFFFHPSAWCHHLARIDASLRPDVYLAELSQRQWRNPALRRLLIQGCLILPVWVGLFVGLGLLGLGESAENIAFGVAVGLAASAVGSIAGGVVVGIAAGIASSIVAGLVVGLLFGTVVGATGLANLSSSIGTAAISVAVMQSFIHPVALVGLNMPNLAASVAVSVAKRQPIYSMRRQLSGAVLGILLSLTTLTIGGWVVAGWVSRDRGLALHPLAFLLLGVAMGTFYGLALAWRTLQRQNRWRRFAIAVLLGAVLGFAVSIGLTLENSIVKGLAIGGGNAALLTTLFALPYVLSERIAGTWGGAVAGTVGSGGVYILFASAIGGYPLQIALPASAICILLGLTLAQWRPLLSYPVQALWNQVLYRLDEQRLEGQPSLLALHAAFWDEFQYLPFPGLDRHLVLLAERHWTEGQAAIDFLSASRQRWAARAAQIELDARQLERCADLNAIASAHQTLAAGELEGPASALLRSLSRVSEDADAALKQASAYNQRLALTVVADRLDGLLRELTRSSERYGVRFRPIVRAWGQVVRDRIQTLTLTVEQRQEIDSPYIIGVPLTQRQEIFVGRREACDRIERLLRSPHRSPLLLYGQRRMGKTSLLNHLGRLLPDNIIPLFVDLQGTASRASDLSSFLYNLARAMTRSAQHQRDLQLPPLSRAALTTDPFTGFDEWLDTVEQTLGENTALLALDEFEVLASALQQGRFDETAILNLLRHWIQHRPHFQVLLSGSHPLESFQRWASHLINLQVIPLNYLSTAEARQLIESPVKDFALHYDTSASQRVLNLTRSHPFLVQLLCAEIVALKNEQDPAIRFQATRADVEAAVPNALSSGSFFFADIQRNQLASNDVAILRALAAYGEGRIVKQTELKDNCTQEPALAISHLLQRQLIEPIAGGYRFQVELVRRWFERLPNSVIKF